jgi:hypothetical protein
VGADGKTRAHLLYLDTNSDPGCSDFPLVQLSIGFALKSQNHCWIGSVPERGSVGSMLVTQSLGKFVCARLTRRYRVSVLTRSKCSSRLLRQGYCSFTEPNVFFCACQWRNKSAEFDTIPSGMPAYYFLKRSILRLRVPKRRIPMSITNPDPGMIRIAYHSVARSGKVASNDAGELLSTTSMFSLVC